MRGTVSYYMTSDVMTVIPLMDKHQGEENTCRAVSFYLYSFVTQFCKNMIN